MTKVYIKRNVSELADVANNCELHHAYEEVHIDYLLKQLKIEDRQEKIAELEGNFKVFVGEIDTQFCDEVINKFNSTWDGIFWRHLELIND